VSERGGGDDRPRRSRPGRGSAPPAEGVAFGFQAVRTALREQPRRVDRLLLARGRRDGRLRELVGLARAQGVPFQQVPGEALDRLAGTLRHQGVAARLSGADLLAADELVERLPADGLALVLDGLEDPRNVGAILRTAAGVGVAGVFLPGWRTAGITPAAARTAAGGLELVPVARAGNCSRLLEELEERGLRALALDPREGRPAWEVDLRGGIVLVAGGEEKGVRPGVLGRCRERLHVPIRREIGSLNVSVAVGMVLAEALRQRRPGGGGA
jgi:23S rRNA (guanosine2251-2'-O)-methyltransferase